MATSLKHVKMAMEGDNNPREAVQQEVFSHTPSGAGIEGGYTGERTFVIFKLVNKKQRRLNIDGICHEVINPKTERPETIRLIRGASSIWTSELKELLADKEYINRNRESLKFSDGICRVGVHEIIKLEFARKNKHNVGRQRRGSGKYDYYEYDAAEEAQIRYEKEMNKVNAIIEVNGLPEEKMKKLALFFDIKPYDELGMPKNPQGMRTELLMRASTQPDLVMRYINSTEIDVSYSVRKAIVEAKIDLNGQAGNAVWAGSKGFIAKIPSGRKPLEYLTEFAMTNSNEGKQFREQLEQMT